MERRTVEGLSRSPEVGGDGGRSMTKADEYRRYAAQCLALSQNHANADDKARLLTMAEMWLRIAEVAEKNQGKDESPRDDVVS
jgi:hypothetical protein